MISCFMVIQSSKDLTIDNFVRANVVEKNTIANAVRYGDALQSVAVVGTFLQGFRRAGPGPGSKRRA